jgi:hypothetical protein
MSAGILAENRAGGTVGMLKTEAQYEGKSAPAGFKP